MCHSRGWLRPSQEVGESWDRPSLVGRFQSEANLSVVSVSIYVSPYQLIVSETRHYPGVILLTCEISIVLCPLTFSLVF